MPARKPNEYANARIKQQSLAAENEEGTEEAGSAPPIYSSSGPLLPLT
jgi:hypothetical protein